MSFSSLDNEIYLVIILKSSSGGLLAGSTFIRLNGISQSCILLLLVNLVNRIY